MSDAKDHQEMERYAFNEAIAHFRRFAKTYWDLIPPKHSKSRDVKYCYMRLMERDVEYYLDLLARAKYDSKPPKFEYWWAEWWHDTEPRLRQYYSLGADTGE